MRQLGQPVHSASSSRLVVRTSSRIPICTESPRPIRTAGVDRIVIASFSLTVSARDESPITTVATSGAVPLISSTGPRRLSHVVTDAAPEGPIAAGRRGTDESIAGVLRRCSQPFATRATASAIRAWR